ncbi:LysR family transcriptional regulator [Granulosicoccus sp.]|nr:LysR family transcriptional regulator [Granulosicoccus sp.]
MPTWNDIELLNAIMESGTLSGAGRMLQIDQTTAARRLSRLEKDLGGALFDRHDGKLNSTTLLMQAEKAILNMADASKAAEAILSRARGELAGRVTISCLGFYATNVLALNLNKLFKFHSKIIIDIVSEDRTVNIEQRQADIAIRFAWPEESNAVMRRLASIKFRRYRALDAAPHNAPIVQYTEALVHLPEMQLMSALRPEAAPILRADRLDLLANAAASIGGEVMLPEWMGDSDQRLARVDDETSFAERPIILLVHPERRKAPSVAAVKDWLYGLHGLDVN